VSEFAEHTSGDIASAWSAAAAASPAQLLVAGGDQLNFIAASANVLERDAERRIGPAPPLCPATHLTAFVSTPFPTVAALRSTRTASEWHFLAVDSFLQARDDDGVAQFLAAEPPAPNGVRRGPILAYAVRVLMRDSAASAAPAATVAAAGGVTAADSPAASGSSAAGASAGAGSASTSAATATSASGVGGGSATASRYLLFVHGARSRIDEQMINWSADWEQIDLNYVPIGITHVELPRSDAAHRDSANVSGGATPAAVVDEEGGEQPDGDSDTASQRSRGSASSHNRRRRPNSTVSAAAGTFGTTNSSLGRRCAILVLGGDGAIHTYSQTEAGMRFVECTSGAWWIAALRGAGALPKALSRSSSTAHAGASTTPIASNVNTNTPTTPVASRPSSPRGALDDALLADATLSLERDFFAPADSNLLPASSGVPLTVHHASTHDADHFVFAVGYHSGLVRLLLAPSHNLEAEFGSVDSSAPVDDSTQRAPPPPLMRWFDGPIAAVRLFRDAADGAAATPINLVVVGALGFAVIYEDVLRHGLGRAHMLPQSDAFDALLCATVIDSNSDGRNELLIGTFSGHVLVYARAAADEWRLVDTRQLGSAVHSILPFNMLGGTEPSASLQLAVNTSDGVQLMIRNALASS
jgi:hypothetical protein